MGEVAATHTRGPRHIGERLTFFRFRERHAKTFIQPGQVQTGQVPQGTIRLPRKWEEPHLAAMQPSLFR